MKVDVISSNNRKLVAVVDCGGKDLFVKTSGGTIFLATGGRLVPSLEELLDRDVLRKPVYEGDTVTITF